MRRRHLRGGRARPPTRRSVRHPTPTSAKVREDELSCCYKLKSYRRAQVDERGIVREAPPLQVEQDHVAVIEDNMAIPGKIEKTLMRQPCEAKKRAIDAIRWLLG